MLGALANPILAMASMEQFRVCSRTHMELCLNKCMASDDLQTPELGQNVLTVTFDLMQMSKSDSL